MTRREIIKRTGQYLTFYITFIILMINAHILLCFSKKYKIPELQKNQIIFLIPIFILNIAFYYRYLYDVQKRNICEATIIPLRSDGKRRMLDILGRVIEGTTVGRNKRTLILKPRRKTDYVFRTRGDVPGDSSCDDTIKIKYLKYSKIILEAEVIEKKTMWLFEYSKKDRDFLLSSKHFYMKNPPYTMEEAKELTKEGKIECIYYPIEERVKKIIGGIVYSILVGPLILIFDNLLLLIILSIK